MTDCPSFPRSTEDCVEELFHMVRDPSQTFGVHTNKPPYPSPLQMHCVDACAAPRLFKRLV